jgi:serine/threonine protein kinase/predicted lipid-binding transport protein (Tim44 family)
MAAQQDRVPTTAELQAFGLGKLNPHREGEVEAYLARNPECWPVLEAAPDDEVVRPLRGAGALPPPRARSPLLQLAVEAVIPVLGGCAGALAGGAAGGLIGVVAGQVAEKGINLFGQRIVNKWLEWFRGKPRGLQQAAVAQLAEVLPEVARSEVASALEQQAPQVSPADQRAAIDYLSAIPRSVRRSLLTGREKGGRTLPPTLSLDDPFRLLQLLPADVPPYSTPAALPDTDYQLEELIGSGGFGAVYRASSPSLQYLPLAIKFCLDRSLLPALQQERTNLERLLQAGGASWSPRIVRLYGYNLEHRTPYLVYEYVSGGDLVHWLATRQTQVGHGLTPAEVLELITQVAEALAFAHQHGLVHRDLKPANVLMADGTIKLADFGIGGLVARQAMQMSRIGTVAGSRLSPAEQASLFRGAGTPLYMSKEQREGQAPDPRHDLYSLGVMWYQLLVGDVTRELHPGWAEELAEEHAVPAAHVETIKQCIGLLKRRPENASKLLGVLRGLTAPGATLQTDAAQVKTAENEPPEVFPLEPLPAPRAPAPIQPGPESERFRHLGLVTRVKQLQKCHQDLARLPGKESSVGTGIILGLFGGIPGGVVGGGVTYALLEKEFGNIALTTVEGIAAVVGFLIGIAILGTSIWLSWHFWRKARAQANQKLAAKIDELVADFPQEVHALGGSTILRDEGAVRELLRHLEAPPR